MVSHVVSRNIYWLAVDVWMTRQGLDHFGNNDPSLWISIRNGFQASKSVLEGIKKYGILNR